MIFQNNTKLHLYLLLVHGQSDCFFIDNKAIHSKRWYMSLQKKTPRGNVTSETIKLAIAYMKRTTDSIRKTATAKDQLG